VDLLRATEMQVFIVTERRKWNESTVRWNGKNLLHVAYTITSVLIRARDLSLTDNTYVRAIHRNRDWQFVLLTLSEHSNYEKSELSST
jgi:hypothetical protein